MKHIGYNNYKIAQLQMSTYIMSNKSIKLESLYDKPSKIQKKTNNVNQPEVSQKLARLERYFQEEHDSSEVALETNRFRQTVQCFLNQGSPSCRFLGQYLCIITKSSIAIEKFFAKKDMPSISNKRIKMITSNDEIVFFDLQINTESEFGLDILYVTKNINGIFSVHLNSERTNINLNEIYGIAFLKQKKTFLVRQKKDFLIYSTEMNQIGHAVAVQSLQFPIPDILNFAELPTIIKQHQNRIFFAYTALVINKNDSNKFQYFVVFEEYEINMDENQKIKGLQRVIVQSSTSPKIIHDMIIVCKENHGIQDQASSLQVHILLQNQIIFIRKKRVQNNYSYEEQRGDSSRNDIVDENYFFTVECSIKPQKIKKGTGINQKPQEEKPDNVFLIQADNERKQKKLMVLHCQYKHNTEDDPSTISIYTQKPQLCEDAICSINYGLIDIIFVDSFGPTQGRIIYSFEFSEMIMFVLHDPNHKELIYIMYSYKIKVDEKRQLLFPKKLPLKEQADIISQQRLSLLLRFYELGDEETKQNNKKLLYKELWNVIKRLAQNQSLKQQMPNQNTKTDKKNNLLFKIIGKNIDYLYKTEQIQYIIKQIEQLIEKGQSVSIDILRSFFKNIKRIASCQIEFSKDNNNAPLSEYLTSVFYIKKLQELQNQNDISQIQYQRWKKRNATQYFYQNWGQQKKISSFIERYYSFFLYHYEDILKEIIQNYTDSYNVKYQPNSTWKSDVYNILNLLPQYPSEGKLRQIYEKQANTNRENDPNPILPIDCFVNFPNISHTREQTTIDDILLEFPNLDSNSVQKLSTYLSKNYMRSNDFLCISRKDLQKKQKNLTINKQAIYIFLELIRDKIKNSPAPVPGQFTTLSIQSQQVNEFSLEWVLQQLKSHRHISNKQYFRLSISIAMYQLIQKYQFQDIPILSQFLAKDELEKVGYFLFDQKKRSVEEKIEIFQQIQQIWSSSWMRICEPGDKYFRHVLNSNKSQYNTQLDNFNNKDQIDSLIFESVFKRFFMQKEDINRDDRLDKLLQLFQLISEIQQSKQSKFKLLVEFLLQSVFQTVLLVSENEQRLLKMVQLLKSMTFLFQKFERNDEYYDQKYQSVALKIRALNFVCKNFSIFKQFNLQLTISNLRQEPDQQAEKVQKNYLFELIQGNKNHFEQQQTKKEKWLEEMSKMQNILMSTEQSKQYTIYYYQEQQNPDEEQNSYYDQQQQLVYHQTFQINRLTDIFNMQKKLMQIFNINKSESDMNYELMQNFYEVALKATYDDNLIQKFSILELVDIQLLVITNKQESRNQNQNYSQIQQQQNLMESTTKFYIEKAKLQNKFDFILECLQILKKMNNESSKHYIKIQQFLVTLKKKNFQPHQVSKIKTQAFNLAMKTKGARKQQIQQNYMIYMSQYMDQKINQLFQKRLPQFDQLKPLITNFPKSYFLNIEAKDNKPFQPDYIVIKLLIDSNKARKAMNDKTLSQNKNQLLFQTDEKSNNSKIKVKEFNQINPAILNFLSFYFTGTDPDNYAKTISDNFDLFRIDWIESKQASAGKHTQLNEPDIRIYSYFPQYISKIEYYFFGKMLQNEKSIDNYNRQNLSNINDRTFKTNMIFLVRYWSELKLQLDKVILMINISLNQPYRYKANKQLNIKEVSFMLANLLEGNKQIYKVYSFQQLKDLRKKYKNADKEKEKILSYLDQFMNRLKYFEKQEIVPPPLQIQNQQKTAESNHDHPHNLSLKSVNQTQKNSQKRGSKKLAQKKSEDINDHLQKYFHPDLIQKFIAKVEKEIASGGQKVEKSQYEDFNLRRFRTFVTCIKFDKSLTKMFNYEFFFGPQKQLNAQQLFDQELKSNVREYINETNYLKIAKALRYGFRDNLSMELNVIKLFLEKIATEYQKKVRKEQEKQFQRKVKDVLDMIDINILKMNTNSILDPIKMRWDDSQGLKYSSFQKVPLDLKKNMISSKSRSDLAQFAKFKQSYIKERQQVDKDGKFR